MKEVDFVKLKFSILEKIKKVVNNVNGYDIAYVFAHCRKIDNIDYYKELDKIKYKAISSLIEREEFEKFLKALKQEIENEKRIVGRYYDEVVLRGIFRFEICCDYDFYIKVNAFNLILEFWKIPIRSIEDLVRVISMKEMFFEFKMDEESKKELILLLV